MGRWSGGLNDSPEGLPKAGAAANCARTVGFARPAHLRPIIPNPIPSAALPSGYRSPPARRAGSARLG